MTYFSVGVFFFSIYRHVCIGLNRLFELLQLLFVVQTVHKDVLLLLLESTGRELLSRRFTTLDLSALRGRALLLLRLRLCGGGGSQASGVSRVVLSSGRAVLPRWLGERAGRGAGDTEICATESSCLADGSGVARWEPDGLAPLSSG